MNPNPSDIEKRLADQREMIEKIYVSVEKTRKYFLWTLVISIVVIVLPLIGLMFEIPSFLSLYNSDSLNGLTQTLQQ